MKETAKALAAYAEYERMGPDRSLAKLAKRGQSEGKPWTRLATLEAWSSAHQWALRSRAYDAEQLAEQRRKQEADIEAMNMRQAQLGVTLQLKLYERLLALIGNDDVGAMAAIQGLRLGMDVERTARGVPAERTSIELTGKDGAPITSIGHVAVYLPQKNPPPGLRSVPEDEEAGGRA